MPDDNSAQDWPTPTVSVVDYYDERLPELTIPLDPTKGPQANMDAYFAKYRKFVSAQREISPRVAAIENASSNPMLSRFRAYSRSTRPRRATAAGANAGGVY